MTIGLMVSRFNGPSAKGMKDDVNLMKGDIKLQLKLPPARVQLDRSQSFSISCLRKRD